MSPITELEARLGLSYLDYQRAALDAAAPLPGPRQRRCLYYRTGAGKTLTSLSLLSLWGQTRAVVIAPPSTQPGWVEWGVKVGVEVVAISHAKFRQKDYRLDRKTAVIVDEFHLLGGHGAAGFKKMDRLAAGLNAPLILLSATPNYNDAERVYCVQHILDPDSCRGGYVQFLYTHCDTEENPFRPGTPDVTGFKNYPDAAGYLSALPNVDYLPDDLVYQIVDISYSEAMPPEYEHYGLNRRKGRLVASQIEDSHTRRYQGLVGSNGALHPRIKTQLIDLLHQRKSALIFANHATIAEAVGMTLAGNMTNFRLVTGKTSPKLKDSIIKDFNRGLFPYLVGTASLATGTDGMDKVCDNLVILDDTDDASLRRQLIGRIMPRGLDTDASGKHVYRLVPTP